MKEQALEMLQTMASQLGTTVGYLWEVLVRQAYVEGVTNLLFLFMFGVVILLCITRFIPDARLNRHETTEIFLSFLVAGLLFGSFFLIHETVTAFLNPEY